MIQLSSSNSYFHARERDELLIGAGIHPFGSSMESHSWRTPDSWIHIYAERRLIAFSSICEKLEIRSKGQPFELTGIGNIYVNPEFRCLGTCRSMIAHIRQHSACQVGLLCLEPLTDLYRKCGLQPVYAALSYQSNGISRNLPEHVLCLSEAVKLMTRKIEIIGEPW